MVKSQREPPQMQLCLNLPKDAKLGLYRVNKPRTRLLKLRSLTLMSKRVREARPAKLWKLINQKLKVVSLLPRPSSPINIRPKLKPKWPRQPKKLPKKSSKQAKMQAKCLSRKQRGANRVVRLDQ